MVNVNFIFNSYIEYVFCWGGLGFFLTAIMFTIADHKFTKRAIASYVAFCLFLLTAFLFNGPSIIITFLNNYFLHITVGLYIVPRAIFLLSLLAALLLVVIDKKFSWRASTFWVIGIAVFIVGLL